MQGYLDPVTQLTSYTLSFLYRKESEVNWWSSGVEDCGVGMFQGANSPHPLIVSGQYVGKQHRNERVREPNWQIEGYAAALSES